MYKLQLKRFSYTLVILAAAGVALAFPRYFLSLGTFPLKKLISPLIQIITFGVGSTMSWRELRGVVKMPKAVLAGIVCHFTIMPLVGYTIATLFHFPPEIAAGVVLVGCSPSGLASNVIAFIAKANLALSVTITACSTLLAPLLTPLLMKWLGGQFVPIDPVAMFVDIMSLVILPILLGVLFNHFFGHRKKIIEKVMPKISMAGVAFIIIVTLASGRDYFLTVGGALIAAMFLHMTIGLLLGYWGARLLSLPENDCRTIAIEVGMQNGGLASGIAAQMGKIATVGLAPAINGPIMNTTFSIVGSWWGRRPVVVASVLLLLMGTGLRAQPVILSMGDPASENMSAERLQRIDKMLQGYVDEHKIAGATALIARDGKIVYYKALGLSDPDTKQPMRVDHIFRIASQTKAVTAVAVMMLLEEGKFFLDEPISKYLPAFAHPVVLDQFKESDTTYTTLPAKREITIRDLLRHTSGIDYPLIGTPKMKAIYAKAGIPIGFESGPRVLKEEMDKLGKLPLAHQPGEKWTYGLNSDVLGYLVETVSGMSLADFFRVRIFEPLGMTDTYFYLPPSKLSRLVPVQEGNPAGPVRKWVRQPGGPFDFSYPTTAHGTYYSGGAGLSSTVKDYAIFCQMLLNGGVYNGKRLLSRRSIEMMTMNQIGDLEAAYGKFGLGFGLISPKEMAVSGQTAGSFHWGGFFDTNYWVDPAKHLVCLFYFQQYPFVYGEVNDKFKFLVYQALND